MDFNSIFEIFIALSILVVLFGAIMVQRSNARMQKTNSQCINKLGMELKLAKQKKEVLSQKITLANGLYPRLFSNMFYVVKQLLSLQKFLIKKSLL